MNDLTFETISEERAMQYERTLMELYGLVVGGKELWHLLGYKTGDAFRQAVKRNTLPVPTFVLKGRRARMARVRDIAEWLASVDQTAEGYQPGVQGIVK